VRVENLGAAPLRDEVLVGDPNRQLAEVVVERDVVQLQFLQE
jgi:hypothetical protein